MGKSEGEEHESNSNFKVTKRLLFPKFEWEKRSLKKELKINYRVLEECRKNEKKIFSL